MHDITTNFTSSMSRRIKDWLSGSKTYITKVSICVRSFSDKDRQENIYGLNAFSTKADPASDLSILDHEVSFPIWGPIISQAEEEIEVWGVRFKYSGTRPDLSFRASSLQFIWPNYHNYIKGKDLRTVRFYLRVFLEGPDLAGASLFVSDYYKIKTASAVYSSSNSSGADAQVEAIPWIYEYNEKRKDGMHIAPYESGWYTDSWFTQKTWDREESDVEAPESYANSWNAVSRFQKILHDRRKILDPQYPDASGTDSTQNRPGVFTSDAPCPYTGPIFTLIKPEFDASNKLRLNVSKNDFYVNVNTNMGVKKAAQPYEATALTELCWWALSKGAFLRTSTFNKRNYVDDVVYEGNYPYPLDVPHVEFFRLIPFLESPDIAKQNVREEDIFSDIEDTDSDVFYTSHYSYIKMISDLRLKTGTGGFSSHSISLSSPISGLAKFSISDALQEAGANGSDFGIAQVNAVVYRQGAGEVSAQRTNPDTGKSVSFMWQQFDATSTELQYYMAPGDLQFLAEKIEFDIQVCKRTQTEWIVPDFTETKGTLITVDTKGYCPASSINDTEDESGKLLHLLTKFTEGIKFMTEWRPWIQVYDIIKVPAQNAFGERFMVTGLVLSVDANADTMSAEYDCLVLSKDSV